MSLDTPDLVRAAAADPEPVEREPSLQPAMHWSDLPGFEASPRHQVPLGWDVEDGMRPCWSSPSDSIGIVGPPRYGKTSGLIIPAVMRWAGPVVCTSTRADILNFAGNHRRDLAAPSGGRVYVYDPFDSERVGGTVGWSPLTGCADPAVCYRRVAAMTGAVAGRVEDADHWRAGAASVLRPYFHAAAIEGLPLSVVRRWLARQETEEPAAILRSSGSRAAMWADDLDAAAYLGDRERGSFYSVARNALIATAEPTVLASCDASDFDVDSFLSSRSALFVIGPSHHQAAVAPLVAALVDSVVHRASERAAEQGGRLDPPLLLALDEVVNIAPVSSLPSIVSEGGGRGIVTMWAVQSLAQLRGRYGVQGQAAILAATTAKVIFGGLSEGNDLRNISSWTGSGQSTLPDRGYVPPRARPHAPPVPFGFHPTAAGGAGALAAATDPARSNGAPRRQVESRFLSVNAIQQTPPFHAWLFYRSQPPREVQARPAALIDAYARLRGYTPDQS